MMTDPGYRLETRTKLVIAGALAYVVLPLDVIPDFLPMVGWIDDAFVLGYTINSIAKEIERFRAYKKGKG
jgi:uncharacterized membrane protein YkvA (DUF1232 family)